MKTNVTQSSISAYRRMDTSAQKNRILTFMAPGRSYSRRTIAESLRLQTGTVSGRVNELIQSEKIKVVGSIKCPFGQKTVEAVALADS